MYNVAEIVAVRSIIAKIQAHIDPSQIGIISFYKAQLVKLKEHIEFPCEIATVDSFQVL